MASELKKGSSMNISYWVCSSVLDCALSCLMKNMVTHSFYGEDSQQKTISEIRASL